MFESIEMAPPDPILGLTEAFNQDPNAEKINLGVGVYKDAQGKTPVLDCVKRAQQIILDQETSKSYKPIHGAPEYGAAVQRLLLGADHEVVVGDRAATAHTPGGTGALRVAGDYLKKNHPNTRIWLSNPTWANHGNIFKTAGLEIKSYPYFDPDSNSLAFDSMLQALQQVPSSDAVLLHGCCHNPTGVDPTEEQWNQLAQVVQQQGFLPLIDFAYQGFAQGIPQDALGLRCLAQPGAEMLICSSFSKNFGLYNERVGALTVVAPSTQTAQVVMSQIKLCIRANYSNPPAHGGAIVTTILADPTLRAQWEGEVQTMRERINAMRQKLVDQLKAHGVKRDFSFITRQRGMFSFTGLNKDQIQTLRQRDAIYIVGSGRINVAGVTDANVDRLCRAIASVL